MTARRAVAIVLAVTLLIAALAVLFQEFVLTEISLHASVPGSYVQIAPPMTATLDLSDDGTYLYRLYGPKPFQTHGRWSIASDENMQRVILEGFVEAPGARPVILALGVHVGIAETALGESENRGVRFRRISGH